MKKRSVFSNPRCSLVVLALAALAPACGGSAQSEPPAAAPPPAPPPPPPVAEAPPPPPPAPAPVAEAPPPAPEPKRPHHHGMGASILHAIDTVDVKAEQKPTIEGIKADLAKLGEGHKELGQKLVEDVADGVAAGKIDKKKTDADIKALVTSMQNTTAGMQDAAKRLHAALDVEQRKKFVASMREMSEHEHEHGMGMGMHEHGMGMPPDGPKVAGPGPGGPPPGAGPGAPPPPGGPGGPPPGAGPAGGPPGGPGMHEHAGMVHGHLEMLSKELALTPEQTDKLKTKLEAQMKAKEGAMKAKKAAMEKKMKAIGDAFETDKFDPKKVGIGTQAPETAKEVATMRVSFAETVLAVLTPEQRTKFAAHLKEHAADME